MSISIISFAFLANECNKLLSPEGNFVSFKNSQSRLFHDGFELITVLTDFTIGYYVRLTLLLHGWRCTRVQ